MIYNVRRTFSNKTETEPAQIIDTNKTSEKLPSNVKIKLGTFGIILGAIAQLSGINSVIFYSSSILNEVGLKNVLIFLILAISRNINICWIMESSMCIIYITIFG